MPPRIRAGELRHRIRIEGQTLGASDPNTGEQLLTWTTLTTLSAKISPVSGREFFTAKQTQSENSVIFTCRWPRGITITTAHRIVKVSDSRIYDIESVQNIDERSKEMNIVATEHDVVPAA